MPGILHELIFFYRIDSLIDFHLYCVLDPEATATPGCEPAGWTPAAVGSLSLPKESVHQALHEPDLADHEAGSFLGPHLGRGITHLAQGSTERA